MNLAVGIGHTDKYMGKNVFYNWVYGTLFMWNTKKVLRNAGKLCIMIEQKWVKA